MMIYKNKGLIYSEYVLNQVEYMLTERKDIEGHVETFYNCREMGYLLFLHNDTYTKGLCIWIYGHRNSDEPTIAYEESMYPSEANNMFTQETWEDRTYTYESVDKAAQKVVELIENRFRN